MCVCTPTTWACGHSVKIWRYCPHIKYPRVVIVSNSNVPNCDDREELSEWHQVKNCCTLGCCVRNVLFHQDIVKRYEILLHIPCGFRGGQDFEGYIPRGPTAEEKGLEMGDSKELSNAQNLSLSMAFLHLNHCGTVIKPGLDTSSGAITRATMDLMPYPNGPRDIDLADQRSRIWSAFKLELAHGVVRAREADKQFEERIEADLKIFEAAQAKGDAIQAQMLTGLILTTLPNADKLLFQPVSLPPTPVLDAEQLQILSQSKAFASDPQCEITKVLRVDKLEQYRALFMGEDVSTADEDPPNA